MAKRILMPLDQTPAAESIVPIVADLARGAGATVRLLHVAPVPDAIIDHGRVIAYADQETSRLESEGADYLASIEVLLEGVPVECAIRFGTPADEILQDAEEFGADLIAVTTGCRSVLTRALLGSVAEEVVQRATIQVLLLNAPD
jgi:nucleotide-binding universal stress UspA family protein